jgi:XTP/dITP diphosphohydrolase
LTVRIVLASANPDKAHEIRAIIGDAVVLEPRPPHVPDVIEDGATLVDNARLKAIALCAATGLPALADDTGLEVDALGGAPGVWAARYAGEHASYTDNVAKLLGELDGVGDAQRTARFRTVAMVRFPDGSELIGDGVVEGRIARELRGENGFGYDPVFVPIEGDGRSFAEMNADEKHAISHRGRALRALAAQLNASGLV